MTASAFMLRCLERRLTNLGAGWIRTNDDTPALVPLYRGAIRDDDQDMAYFVTDVNTANWDIFSTTPNASPADSQHPSESR